MGWQKLMLACLTYLVLLLLQNQMESCAVNRAAVSLRHTAKSRAESESILMGVVSRVSKVAET